MPAVPVAIACADLHLSHKPPTARAGENWYSAMERPLTELAELQDKLNVPILCAGDIFHHHNPPPELINWAIKHLPQMYAVAGQHDLPFHSQEEIKKSAFWTLVEADTLALVEPKGSYIEGFWVGGFGWGQEVSPPKGDLSDLKLALIHEYVWYDKAKYEGAPSNQQLNIDKYRGYDTVIIGDNHIPWEYDTSSGIHIFNCGSLMRRNADQANHKPRVGIVMRDGSVKSHYLDISHDKLEASSVSQMVDAAINFTEVMEELKRLGGATLDFAALLRQAMEQQGTDPRVAKYLLEALEHGDPDKPKTR